MSRPVRLRDVASHAAVSVSTASRALADSGAISPLVRERVKRVARDLGYGRARASGKLRSVRLFTRLETFSNDAAGFYADIIAGVCEGLAPLGLRPDVVGLASGDGLAAAIATQHRAAPSDGIMLLAVDDPAALDAALATGAAVVLVNGSDQQMRTDSVAPDNIRGAMLATAHLAALGHRRIAHVGAAFRATLADRFTGYHQALQAAGLRFHPADHIVLPNLLPDLAHAAIWPLLARGRPPFSALFCANDLVALGAMRALQDSGIEVPRECSVLGFDDVPTAALARPALSTVAVDRHGIGRMAARLLAERVADAGATPMHVQLGCRLVLRASTAPAPPA